MKKDILVINCGSSSLKFALIDCQNGTTALEGLAEKLGLDGACITFRHAGEKQQMPLDGQDHGAALRAITARLADLGLTERVAAIGHRVVHGGDHFKASTLIDDSVLAAIDACSPLAPLHNPAHLLGIRSAMDQFPSLPQVAVFDTAFHQTMPEHAYRYAVPQALYDTHRVRRYGFHGTSHRYVAGEAARVLDKPLENLAMVSCHLGNGASATAILGGQSVDTTMGLTPLEGLVMGTRSGDIDAGIYTYLASTLNMDVAAISNLLNKESGLLGLSALSSDCRELEEAAAAGHTGALLALEVFCYRLAKHVAALTVALGRLDAVIFTGGIGENSSLIRAKVIGLLGFLGLALDPAANDRCIRGKAGTISPAHGVPALVINTNEELMIARDTAALAGIAA